MVSSLYSNFPSFIPTQGTNVPRHEGNRVNRPFHHRCIMELTLMGGDALLATVYGIMIAGVGIAAGSVFPLEERTSMAGAIIFGAMMASATADSFIQKSLGYDGPAAGMVGFLYGGTAAAIIPIITTKKIAGLIGGALLGAGLIGSNARREVSILRGVGAVTMGVGISVALMFTEVMSARFSLQAPREIVAGAAASGVVYGFLQRRFSHILM